MKYQSTKVYGHEVGLSCCFRQPNARSHCNLLHGYSLSFKFVFEADTLDDRNWVVDFGSLKELKQTLHNLFDHTLAVAGDDPYMPELQSLQRLGLANVKVMANGVGCEKFAQYAFELAQIIIDEANAREYARTGGDSSRMERVKVISCECAEHGANSAIYFGDN